MGRSLTVYILHCGNDRLHDIVKCSKNLFQEGMDVRIEPVPSGTAFSALECDTFWKLFLYSDERLSIDLLKSLPVYLSQDEYNVLTMFRISESELIKDKNKNDLTISVSPRLFYGNVRLKNWSLEPASSEDVKCTRILDGFIIGKIE
jgi:hypothetical protein